MSDLKQINWLASYPKSGNTWVRFLLGAYKMGMNRINVNNEMVVLDNQIYAHQAVSPWPLDKLNHDQNLYLRHAALLHLIARAPHYPVLVKTHSANVRVKDTFLIPDGLTQRAVVIARDPRDVAISYAAHLGKGLDEMIPAMNEMGHMLHTDGENLGAYLASWSAFYKTWLDDGRFPVLLVKYEDLLKDTQAELRRILEFIEIEVFEGGLKSAVDMVAFDKLKKQEEKFGFREATKHTKFFGRGTAGHWREVLTEEQIARIEQDHGEMMRRLGYDLAMEMAA